jgi:hypothetical protein
VVSGPLAAGWARKAGTPASVLASSSSAVGDAASGSSVPTTTLAPGSFPSAGFDARVQGTIKESAPDARGQVVVSLAGALSAGATGTVDVELTGTPLAGGGVGMRTGTVALSDGAHSYQGAVVGLAASQVVADGPGPNGASWRVTLDFTQLDQQRGTMAADVHVGPGDRFRGGDGRGGGDNG